MGSGPGAQERRRAAGGGGELPGKGRGLPHAERKGQGTFQPVVEIGLSVPQQAKHRMTI